MNLRNRPQALTHRPLSSHAAMAIGGRVTGCVSTDPANGSPQFRMNLSSREPPVLRAYELGISIQDAQTFTAAPHLRFGRIRKLSRVVYDNTTNRRRSTPWYNRATPTWPDSRSFALSPSTCGTQQFPIKDRPKHHDSVGVWTSRATRPSPSK